jgi:acetyltransferase-like isoleucine patch superfamily enzyme
MKIAGKALEVIRRRPTFFYPYVRQTWKFYQTRFLYKFFRPKGIFLGKNVRIQAFSSIRVVRPVSQISIGDNTVIWETCRLEAIDGGRIEIGSCAELDGITVASKKLVKIGNYTGIANNTLIQDFLGHPTDPEERKRERQMRLLWFSPHFDNTSRKSVQKRQEYDQRKKPVIIEDNVLIYSNCIITRGVTIGENSVIGSNSVVNKDIPANSFAAGNPAVIIKTI